MNRHGKRTTRAGAAGSAAGPDQDRVPPPAPEAAAPSPSAGLPANGRIESWPIASLMEHGQQAALYHDLEGADFEDLVASLARKGLEVAVDVTPDGIIIDGHQRVRAAQHLGWSEITVRVRDDLAGDPVAIELARLQANKTRRQLDGLDKVRLTRRELELQRGRRWADFTKEEKKQLYDLLERNYGYSSRHAQRLINILGTPMAVQRAVSRERLTVVQADRVSRLGWSKQQKIAREIDAGGDPAEIVASYLPRPGRKIKPADAYERLVAELLRGLDALDGREGETRRSASQIRSDLEVFARFERFREIVVPMLERKLEESECAWEEFRAAFGQGDTTDDFDSAVA